MDGGKPQVALMEGSTKVVKTSELIGTLAGATVVGTIAFSVIGYIFARSYLDELGAPWAIDLLGSTTLITLAAPVAALFVLALFGGTVLLESVKDGKTLLIIGTSAVIICLAIWFTSEIFKGAAASTIHLLLFLIMYVVVVSCLTAHTRRKLREGQPIFANVIRDYVAFAILIWLFAAPHFFAKAVGRIHTNPTYSTLARTHFIDQPNTEWRLVKAIGDKALILKLAETVDEREFRVVPMEKIRVSAKRPS
ncbi:hypothetical protein PHO31112_03537 [Pandoraea horticolens]|uniref:Uncharacterized protein n=1 Tax=Pandoraea horticolens TaxID=2508298 RepID=A0A5E4WW43_9BURK|nr:hypothetical protein [Pandoraea horticolens]VVE28992.1 hypothetical protein PHO31112_03537 [Pandoraea horticolens]